MAQAAVVRRIDPACADFQAILELALSGSELHRTDARRLVRELLADARQSGRSMNLLFAAYRQGRLAGAVSGIDGQVGGLNRQGDKLRRILQDY
jgi:hypothetical protein